FVRADDDADFAGVAARDAFQFGTRIIAGVQAYAAFSAAKGQVDCCGFDGHPSGQGHDFRQRDILVIANAALAGATRDVVLDTVAFEVGDRAVIELYRDIHNQHTLRTLERLNPFSLTTQVRGHPFHLLQINAPRADMIWFQV